MACMNKLQQHIEKHLVKDSSIRYFVACSGGIDSMVLLHILYKLGKNVSALHVNYLLRGEDSEGDQQLVEQVCMDYKIPCHVKRINLRQVLEIEGGSLQETARNVRYRYFENFKLKDSIKVVLAHHADDQVETFFLNLSRGGGIMGLSCMLPEHNRYLRPLLPFTREEIRNYAEVHKIRWREDSSNSESKYNRNKLRNILLPELEKQFPQLRQQVLTLVEAFQQTQKTLEERVAPLVKSVMKQGELKVLDFDLLDDPELREFIRQLELTPGLEKELLKLRKSQPGKHIFLNHPTFGKIIREREHFFFERNGSRAELPVIGMEIVNALPEHFDKTVIYLDREKLSGKLELRQWKPGDRIKPIGIKGSKLISDILTDNKVPVHERKSQLVLCDDEKILWCIGHSVSREAIARPDSDILKITVRNPE